MPLFGTLQGWEKNVAIDIFVLLADVSFELSQEGLVGDKGGTPLGFFHFLGPKECSEKNHVFLWQKGWRLRLGVPGSSPPVFLGNFLDHFVMD